MKHYLQDIKYNNTRIDILRLDLLHPEIQGNKYYKLKYNILQAKQENKSTLLSFGGEYSNHIAALAKYGKKENLKTIGVIRAEKDDKLTSTLQEAENNGMQFVKCNRTDYRNFRRFLNDNKLEEFNSLINEYLPNLNKADTYVIPEGGTNALALKGTQEILEYIENNYTHICCPVGTAGTISGIIASSEKAKIIGFPALKGNFFIKEIEALLKQISNKEYNNWELNSNYHFGAYAAFNEELVHFINQFYKDFKIPLEPIYTGKMFYGIFDMISKNEFPENSKVLAIHTGGLQGIIGFNEKHGDLLKINFA